VVAFFLIRTVDSLDRTVTALSGVQTNIAVLNSRLDAQRDHLVLHDRKFDQYDEVLLRAYRSQHP
jgi:hypothetical protein